MPAERLALVFFVDALGWEVVRDSDCFSSVAPHRWRQRTVLGYSCAAQPTILTGKMPSEHGHWGMFYRAEHSEMRPLRAFGLIPSKISGHHRFRRLVLKETSRERVGVLLPASTAGLFAIWTKIRAKEWMRSSKL